MYLKIANNQTNQNSEKKFLIEDAKKTFIYQRDQGKRKKFQLDYIFSENEDNLNTAKTIKKDLVKYLKNEKNLFFLSFGQEKLGK